MMRSARKYFLLAGLLMLLFVLFTGLVLCVDVKPIGPAQTVVGFASINQFMFRLFGLHLIWYEITDWLGVAAILFAFGFATVGLCQLIKRKSLRKVDGSVLALGIFYVLVIAAYLFFECWIVNYRPVILNGGPEASYPSSHTLIVVCIMVSAALQFRLLCPQRSALCRGMNVAAALIVAVTVFGRLVSGVHWFTDIVGGLLLASALLAFYCALAIYLTSEQMCGK